MASFEIAVACAGDRVVRLAIEGEVDMSTAPQVLDSVLCAAVAHDRHDIVVDLRDVGFMDSAGLDALVVADRRLRELDAHLIVSNPSRTVQLMIEVTGLDEVLDVRPGGAARSLTPDPRPEPSGV